MSKNINSQKVLDEQTKQGVSSALLEVDGLSFSYGTHDVLHDITFCINPGEVVALLGPNGVGKSTLFRCILGFLHGYSGSVRLSGTEVSQLGAKEQARRVAYIPQVSSPVFDFTVLELVLMGMASRMGALSMPGDAHADEAMQALENVGIAHLAHSPCGSVSGGEYQLALLARALLQQAPLLVMDEPTANLDYGNQFRIMQRARSLADQGFSIILSAHDPNQVLAHATRVLICSGGKLLADGYPPEVMTPQLLEELYGIKVARVRTDDGAELCYPRK